MFFKVLLIIIGSLLVLVSAYSTLAWTINIKNGAYRREKGKIVGYEERKNKDGKIEYAPVFEYMNINQMTTRTAEYTVLHKGKIGKKVTVYTDGSDVRANVISTMVIYFLIGLAMIALGIFLIIK